MGRRILGSRHEDGRLKDSSLNHPRRVSSKSAMKYPAAPHSPQRTHDRVKHDSKSDDPLVFLDEAVHFASVDPRDDRRDPGAPSTASRWAGPDSRNGINLRSDLFPNQVGHTSRWIAPSSPLSIISHRRPPSHHRIIPIALALIVLHPEQL